MLWITALYWIPPIRRKWITAGSRDFDSSDMVSKLSVALFKQDAEMLEELVGGMFQFFRDQRYLLTDMVKVCDELSIILAKAG